MLRLMVVLFTALACVKATCVEARNPVLGILAPKPLEDQIRKALQRLGYVQGKNVEFRSANFDSGNEQQKSLAVELVVSKVDLIVATGSPAARAAMEATANIPVVFTSGDPVAGGFANTLARPGRNGTGVSVLSFELYQKCVEFLHELVPRARDVAFFGNLANPLTAPRSRDVDFAARTIGMQVQTINAPDVQELATALQNLSRKTADVVVASGEIYFLAHKKHIADAIRKAKLPACFAYREYHDAGVLMSYGPSNEDMMNRVAGSVEKILTGANPGDLPIEQVTKYELVINLRLSRELGIKVPQDLLLRADEVIR